MNIREYIKECDKEFERNLNIVADAIAKGKERVICLSGPTCSGKTTAASMLAKRLFSDGRKIHIISIDDFYLDRNVLHRLSQEKGLDGIDYDSVDTIDLDTLKSFVSEVFLGEEIHCPVFDFKKGIRTGYRTVRADDDDLFIFEGIQAIYPQVTELFMPIGYVSVYISPRRGLSVADEVIEPNEIRLMRRLVRDSNFRGATAEFTLHMWETVRENEEKNIFPYVDECKYFIDSTLDYELGVLRPYLERILPTVPENSQYLKQARAILMSMAAVEPISSQLVGEDSLYREFV